MFWRILWFFIGYVRCSIPIEQYERAVIALFPTGVRQLAERKRKERISFDFKKGDLDTAMSALKRFGIEMTAEGERGFLSIISKYKNRPGLGIGLLLVILSVFVSGRFLWSIEFSGLDEVDELRALEVLEDHGIYVGCYVPSLELRKIYNEILIDCDEFSWISVNIRGTHATVEVRETQGKIKLTPIKGKCANLVSMYDGQITAVRTYSGESLVKVGDSIREGELLISGLYEDKMGRTVHTYAQGEVKAKFRRDFSVRVPLEYEKKVYTGEKSEKVTVKIFSKSINILNYGRNIDTEYDIIIDNERLRLFDMADLPLLVSRETLSGYTIETAMRDESTARDIAYASIGKEILCCVGEGEILSADYNGYIENGVYVLNAEVYINADITRVQEFVYNEG